MGRTKKVSSMAQQIKNKKPRSDKHIDKIKLVSSPCTLFNCACSDSHRGAFSVGRMVNIIGDSSAGKTMFALCVLAEAARDKNFDDYRLVIDDVENALTFNLDYLFGTKMASRLEPPNVVDDIPEPSDTIEDFHCNIARLLDDEKPFIYVLDSFDALDSDQDQDKVEEMRSAKERGKKAKGTYGMSKAKKASDLLRNICKRLKDTNSILIIISQTRDNIDPMSFEKRTRSGGRALKFYAHHEIWLSCGKKIKSKDTVIGADVIAKITKNKLTGKVRQIKFPIYYDYGVDNTRASIDFLVEKGVFKKTKLTFEWPDKALKGTMPKLIGLIEAKQKHVRILKKLVGKTWNEFEESLKTGRRRRYE